MVIWSIIFFILATIVLSFVHLVALVISGRQRRRRRSVGFFHPYTDDGGGGERVLWCAVRAVQDENSDFNCIIYTGDDTSPKSLSARALDRFGVHLLRPPVVVRLYRRKWIDEKSYPRFTMIGQSLGSVYLCWEALCKFTPQFYFDTSGYAFTYPLARAFGCKVICYTHYPTISSDMVSRVRQRSSIYNNDAVVVRSIWLSRCKVAYYIVFSWLYGHVGSYAHLVMVNSSWTQSHVEKIWKIPARIKKVYPPCDTSALHLLPLERPKDSPPTFISVAQFRPEKAHGLQLEAFSLAIERLNPDMIKPKLQFVGSCRNEEDVGRLQQLKIRVSELCMDEYVEFHKDVKYSELVQLLGRAIVGLHSMIDEHFGISVVEYMAAGAIPIAHDSAGPKMDIVLEEDGHSSGFLATSKEDYANAILKVLNMTVTERLEIAAVARTRAQRFSEKFFYENFKCAIRPIFSNLHTPT